MYGGFPSFRLKAGGGSFVLSFAHRLPPWLVKQKGNCRAVPRAVVWSTPNPKVAREHEM